MCDKQKKLDSLVLLDELIDKTSERSKYLFINPMIFESLVKYFGISKEKAKELKKKLKENNWILERK